MREIALVVNEVMDELGLASDPSGVRRDRAPRPRAGRSELRFPDVRGYAKAPAPIRPELRFPDVRGFAKALAQEVERRVGDQEVGTTTGKVADRRGVFVDFGQNARDRTFARRARSGPRRTRAPRRLWGVTRCTTATGPHQR